MMERIAISATGSDQLEDMEELAAWFNQEPELRGLVKAAPSEPAAGELGSWTGVLVAAVGSGGAASVLAGSLKAFFSQPRGAKVHLTLTRADGTRVVLDVDRAKRATVPELTRQMLLPDTDER